MRPPPGLGHLATVAVLLTVRVAGQNTVDISALQELPRCTVSGALTSRDDQHGSLLIWPLEGMSGKRLRVRDI